MICTDEQIYRQIDRQKVGRQIEDGQVDIKGYRKTDRQIERQRDRQIDEWTDTQIDCIRQIRLNQTDRQTDDRRTAIRYHHPCHVTTPVPTVLICNAMQRYTIHFSCNSECILCTIHRINRKGRITLTKSIFNVHLTTINHLQLPKHRAFFCHGRAVSPTVIVQFCYVWCKSPFVLRSHIFGALRSKLRESGKTYFDELKN